MGFVYVIGKTGTELRRTDSEAIIKEHMEDDDDTVKAIPPWVELEYAVGLSDGLTICFA
jgi:hypothetical protein